jgi:hypothetical protein
MRSESNLPSRTHNQQRITTNKKDQVMITLHASKLKTKVEQNI